MFEQLKNMISKEPQDVTTLKTFRVSGVSYHTKDVMKLARASQEWKMSDKEIAEKFPGQKIYKYTFINTPVRLVPEPKNTHDKNAVMVMIKNCHVGYVPKEQALEVKKILIQNIKVSAEISGGEYKVVSLNGDAVTITDHVSIKITITK